MGKLTDKSIVTSAPDDALLHIVDVNDPTDSASGTSKAIAVASLLSGAGKIQLQEITLGTAGGFDFTAIPVGYKRLIIQGAIRSTDGNTGDDIQLFMNEETTASNYHRTNLYSSGSVSGSQASDAYIAVICGASSAAGAYSTFSVTIEGYAGDKLKVAHGQFAGYTGAPGGWAGSRYVASKTITAALTRLRIRAPNTPTSDLLGTLTLYGEK